ncbi:MAG: MotA/TolQ/ExbB proton channel family protein [Oscillospiraceae bacterium]|nr:MotA/TolQ/ExbB proton channel family protein [Oscillospiraceae bacterium]
MKGITSILGMVLCFVAIFGGIVILGGNLGDFLNIPSFLMVIIPTIGSMLASFPLQVLAKVPSHFKIIMGKEHNPKDYIEQIVLLAQKARREGLLALENEQVDDTIMQYALRMLVDGREEADIRASLDESLNGIKERHLEAVSVYEKAGAFAPAYGMCGTVVSLINMLMALDFSDPSAINKLGANMSAALITTLYGTMLANIIFLPLAGKLKVFHKKEMFCKTMICNGILALHSGVNPQNIRDYLVEQLDTEAKGLFEGIGGGN